MGMSNSTGAPTDPWSLPGWVLRELFRRQRTLAALGLGLLVAAILMTMALAIDPRTLDGVNVWAKPLKFATSFALFLLTLAWFVGYLAPGQAMRWPTRAIVAVASTAVVFEMAYITFQAARQEPSHFNNSEPLYSFLYVLMGIGAVTITLTGVALAVLIWRVGDTGLPPAFRMSVVLGLVLTFVLGSATGILMSASGGHFVGGPQVEPGLPLFGWSTVGGDWRVPHFFGVHAQQILPLFAAFVGWMQWPREMLADGLATTALILVTLLTFVQAALDRPFLPL